jgi:hypothetical protein
MKARNFSQGGRHEAMSAALEQVMEMSPGFKRPAASRAHMRGMEKSDMPAKAGRPVLKLRQRSK